MPRSRNRRREGRRRRQSPPTPSATTYDEDEEDPEEDDKEEADDVSSPREETTSDSASASYSYDLSSGSAAVTETPPSLTPPSYIPVAPLPIFRGGAADCPVSHLRRFSRVCLANNAPRPDTMARLFPVTLDGEAALWYELRVEPLQEISWEELKLSFLSAFCSPEMKEQCRSDLMALKQSEKETVNAYYLRLQGILRKWPAHGIPDGILKGIFVDGLKEYIHEWVLAQRPDSLEEAFRLAVSCEQVRRTRETRRTEEKCGFCEGTHEEGSCEVRRGMRELWLRSKEKAQRTRVLAPGSPVGFRSFSMSERTGREEEAGGKSPCACSKHECWKKSDRNGDGALVEVNPSPTTD